MSNVIAVMTRKGGQGKTTIATHLAVRLAQWVAADGKRVLLVDTDPQGHAAAALGVDAGGRCGGDLLLGKRTFKETVLSANRPDVPRPNLYVVPADSRLSQSRSRLERDIVLDMMQEGRRYKGPQMDEVLERALGPYLSLFEYVILDCPPSMANLEAATFKITRWAVVPARMAYLDSHGARLNLDDVTAAQDSGYGVRIAAVVPTFYRERELVARGQLGRFREVYGERLVAEPIPQSAAVEQAQASGQRTLFELDMDLRLPVTQAMDSLARRVRAL